MLGIDCSLASITELHNCGEVERKGAGDVGRVRWVTLVMGVV